VFHIRPEVLHQYVGGLCQSLEHLDAARILQVERERALVTMQVLKVRVLSQAQNIFTFPSRYFDLDDVGAPIGELPGAGRSRAHARQVDNAEMRKGFHDCCYED
jgi:hypothetical protein